jgi:hypothetical protein
MNFVQQGPTPTAGATVRGLIGLTAQAMGAGLKSFPDGIGSAAGANAADIVQKIGTSLADGALHGSARLLSIRSGLGGAETEYAFFRKPAGSFSSVLTLDMRSLGNTAGLNLTNPSTGDNGIYFGGGASGGGAHVGTGNGFFDVSASNRCFRFSANNSAFSTSPLAYFLHDLLSAGAAVPLMMARAPSGFAQDLQRWRTGSTDVARVAADGVVYLGAASNLVLNPTPGSSVITSANRPLYLYGAGTGGVTETVRAASQRADAGLKCVVVGTENAAPNAAAVLLQVAHSITTNGNDAGNGTALFRIFGDGTLESFSNDKGIILRSADGTRYRLTVSNAGALVIAAA